MLAGMMRASLVGALLLAAASAAAQGPAQVRGLMQATAYAPLPDGAPLALRPPDGSQPSRDMALVLGEALARLGRGSDPGAPHQLSFRIGDVPGVAVPRPPDIELRGALGSSGHDDAEVVLRLQMLDRARPRPSSRARLLIIEVSDRAGAPLWRARVEASGAEDDVRLVEALAPLILARLGEPAYDLQLMGPPG